MARWWEKEPLRFECQTDCFKCCQKPGIVSFDKEDMTQTAEFLGLTPGRFKSEYLKREDGEWMLEVTGDEPCRFLTLKGCRIHPVKPKQCRAYPFWRENMDSKNTWKLVGIFCPGIDRGPMVPKDAIKKMFRLFRD